MPFIKKSMSGEIISVAIEKLDSSYNYVEQGSQAVSDFLEKNQLISKSSTQLDALEDSDKTIARVTEDLINLLIRKKSILFTELPEAVQNKLLTREKLRADYTGDDAISFLDNDESI